jgi:hypothetical protein
MELICSSSLACLRFYSCIDVSVSFSPLSSVFSQMCNIVWQNSQFLRWSLRKALWNSLHMKWNPFCASKDCQFAWTEVCSLSCNIHICLNAWSKIVKWFTIVGAGVVELVADHVVCEEGKPLSPEAAQTLVRSTQSLLHNWFRCKDYLLELHYAHFQKKIMGTSALPEMLSFRVLR